MVIFTVFRWVFIATSTPVIVPCTWCCIVSNLWRERADNRAFRIHQSKWQEWTVLFSNPTEELCWNFFFFTWVPFFISMVTVSWESFIRNRTNFILAEMCLRSETEQIVAEMSIFHEKLDYNQRENESQGRRFRLFMRRRHRKSFGAQQRLNAALSHELGT